MLDEKPPRRKEGDPEMAARVRRVIASMDQTKAEIAERLGVSQQAITGWEKTGRISKKSVAGLAELSGRRLEFLLHGTTPEFTAEHFQKMLRRSPWRRDADGNPIEPVVFGDESSSLRSANLTRQPASDAPGEDDWSEVQGYAQAIGLGFGAEAQEYAETHKLKFRADSLARKRLRPQHLAVMYGKGDSMLPRIRPGDAILFDTSDTRPRDEALFVVVTPGAATNEYSVKRCRDFGDAIYFDALNPEGDHNWRKPRRMDDPKSPVEIIGRVRWIGSWED